MNIRTLIILSTIAMISACKKDAGYQMEVYETSEAGNAQTKLEKFEDVDGDRISIKLNPENKRQTITGFGGSFTESSAYLVNQLSPEKRNEILEAYFGEGGSKYSLTRTHINSCDFSLSNYSYAPVPADTTLENFSIEEDMDDIIPMIKDAMKISKDGFKIISSPWTAPPWMKDNNEWKSGKLLKEYYPTWALFFSKYLEAYKGQGIDIWGLTPENEPLGNGGNWESMHYSPAELTDFVSNYLGPQLEQDGMGAVKILGYDQNREELPTWVDSMFENEETSKYFAGTAVHWYRSTYDYFPKELQYAHEKAPDKHLINSEACVDNQVPVWKDDAWYWKKEATDWGYTWAEPQHKHLHPKYVPVYRYARNIIGSLNNWVDGWVDWNMVLDKQGGPNWAKNWCIAPVIVDPSTDEVYYTPLYHTLSHFSKYLRPGAQVIEVENPDEDLMVTAAENPDGTIAVVILNMQPEPRHIELVIGDSIQKISTSAQAIQTVVLTK